jgi:tRNA dimethylallyltransferase
MNSVLDNISTEQTVLIAGPTASGKSAFALELAARQGGVIVNGDALQIYANWRLLTARPSRDEESVVPHHLYGHVPGDAPYSVGHWLRQVAPLLDGSARAIIVGGTGLYFSALTEGLADIPPTPTDIRAAADARIAGEGHQSILAELDPKTVARIDTANPIRVQRAWEVLRATGRGLADWQDATPPPLLPLDRAHTLLLDADKDWLGKRIERRFDQMLANGALQEVRANMNGWDATRPSAKAIGAPELVAHLRGEMSIDQARDQAIIATRQYAKRQRTWFRSRMKAWHALSLPG